MAEVEVRRVAGGDRCRRRRLRRLMQVGIVANVVGVVIVVNAVRCVVGKSEQLVWRLLIQAESATQFVRECGVVVVVVVFALLC